MKKLLLLAGMVVVTAMLAACHGQGINFDGHSISLHASGQPTATITSRGSFSVGSKLIDVTPAQRQLFLRYFNRIAAIHADKHGHSGGADAPTDANPLCRAAQEARALQATLGQQVAAFAPYRDIDPAPGAACAGAGHGG